MDGKSTNNKIFNELSVGLQQWELESLDTLRDNILTTKGNVTFSVTGIDSVPVLKQFNERLGAVIHTPTVAVIETVDTIVIKNASGSPTTIPESPTKPLPC